MEGALAASDRITHGAPWSTCASPGPQIWVFCRQTKPKKKLKTTVITTKVDSVHMLNMWLCVELYEILRIATHGGGTPRAKFEPHMHEQTPCLILANLA